MLEMNWINEPAHAKMQRAQKFLEESEKLSGITPTDDIDGQDQSPEKRHLKALISCISKFYDQQKLTGEDLETWIRCFAPQAEIDGAKRETLAKIATTCNQFLAGVTPMSSDKVILKAMCNCIWSVESEKDLPLGKHRLARLLAAGVAERGQRPIPIFPGSNQREYSMAIEDKKHLYDYLRKILRSSIYGPTGEPLRALNHEGYNSTYIDSKGEKLMVQWHELYQEDL